MDIKQTYTESELIGTFARCLNGFDEEIAEKLLNSLKNQLLINRRGARANLNTFPGELVFKKYLPCFKQFIHELERDSYHDL